LGRGKFFGSKKHVILPKVISKEKIAALINSIENLKHKTIIMWDTTALKPPWAAYM